MPTVITDTDCVLNEPIEVSTQGVLDNAIGIATLGWIIRADDRPPSVVIPVPPNNIGQIELQEPNRDWWVRKDDSEPWHGPLSYRDANSQARRMTLEVDNTISEVKYAQVGTILGTRGGDPEVSPDMFVAFLYANGRQYLGGRMAEFNAPLVPVP